MKAFPSLADLRSLPIYLFKSFSNLQRMNHGTHPSFFYSFKPRQYIKGAKIKGFLEETSL